MEINSTQPNPDVGATNSGPKSFAYNLMKKMGWTDGKGLGLNEDGETDHIKVRRKRSNAGLGASKETQSSVANGLNDVLAKLATNTSTVSQETKPKIDAKKENQQPRRKQRAFLARRAAGKDVSSYSREQLKEIFGGVLPDVEKDETKNENENKVTEEKDDSVVEVKEIKKLKKKKEKQKDIKIKVDLKIKKSKKSKKEKKSKDKRKNKSEES